MPGVENLPVCLRSWGQSSSRCTALWMRLVAAAEQDWPPAALVE